MKKHTLSFKKWIHRLMSCFSGILLRISKPFKKGDFIEVNGLLGLVEANGWQKTLVKKINGEEVAVPNLTFYTNKVHNLTEKNMVQLVKPIKIDANKDICKTKASLEEQILLNAKILRVPQPKILLKKIDQDYIQLNAEVWCDIDDYSDLNKALEDLFKPLYKSNPKAKDTSFNPKRQISA